jgi:lipopolysaccharide/colanic/teichoic acid biosynthesis glycosyltransferase
MRCAVRRSQVRPRAIAPSPPRLRPLARRTIDIVVLLLAAPFVLVLLALLALAVKLDSPGPVLISVKRVGRAGRLFGLLKLRTMVADAEEQKKLLAHLNVLPWPDFKIPNDPRVTRVGRWLRKTSLDELPQLWNVLRGEMTLVGPRPCSIGVDKYRLWQTERLEVTPGLMGLWQAEGRNEADFAARCRMDIAQLRSRSPAAAVVLAARTVRSVLTSRGSY